MKNLTSQIYKQIYSAKSSKSPKSISKSMCSGMPLHGHGPLQASARMYTCAAVHLRMFPTRTTHAHPMHRCACTDEPLHARHTPVHMHRCDYTDLSLLQRHIHVHMLMYACVCTDMPRHMTHTYTYAPTSMQWHVSTHMCCYMRAACMYSSTGTHARMRPARTTHA